MKKYLFYLGMFMACCLPMAEGAEKIIGDYSRPLNEADKSNIDYIITTLSEHNTFMLFGYQDKLKQAGNSVDYVHPLRHLGYVFSEPNLTQRTHKIDKVPWNRYVSGFKRPLNLAVKQGKMDQAVINDFSKRVGIPVAVLEPYVKQKNWKGFINTIRDHK